ncbi:MAG: hypothetical protein PHS49_03945 [Candidatus Gracilibacteria bacterium]|nr:hypothetical protein [Candidatus Gracilibacteria bacterium]
MLNQDVATRLNSFVNERSVFVDTSWQTYDNKSMINKSIVFYKQTADALLSEDDVKKGFYYSKKNGLVKLEGEYAEGENVFDYIITKEKVLYTVN